MYDVEYKCPIVEVNMSRPYVFLVNIFLRLANTISVENGFVLHTTLECALVRSFDLPLL